MTKPDHKAATKYAETYQELFGKEAPPLAVQVLAACYLELRALAKAYLDEHLKYKTDPDWQPPATEQALRFALGED